MPTSDFVKVSDISCYDTVVTSRIEPGGLGESRMHAYLRVAWAEPRSAGDPVWTCVETRNWCTI